MTQDPSKIQDSFYLFFRNINPDFTVYFYQKFLIDTIQSKLINSKNNHKRLMLSMPPGYGKSFLATQLLPSFLLGNNPTLKICICSYSYSIANNLGKLCKQTMLTPSYRAIFPKLRIVTQGESGTFSTSAGGEIYCVGRGGSITSRRFDLIIADDLLKDSNEAQSDKIMSKLGLWFFSTLVTRLYKTKPTMLLIIATRWHQKDVTGLCLESFPHWQYIALDAIAEESDILKRGIGEVLCKQMQTLEELKAIKASDPKSFSALYQNNPISKESTFFSKEKLEAAKQPPIIKGNKPVIIASFDTANSTGAKNDFTVVTVFKSYTPDINIVTDIIKIKVEFEDLIRLFDKIKERYKPDYIIIENAASGQQLLQLRPDAVASKIFKNSQEKENYSVTLNSRFGETFFIATSCLNFELEEELLSFPFYKHDDFVLSLLHGYRFITENNLKSKATKVTNGLRLLTASKKLSNKMVRKFQPGLKQL